MDRTKIMPSKGWIKLQRSMLDWEWWEDQNTTRLWLTILLLANHEESKWKGQVIRPGQLITSIQNLSRTSGLSERSVRTALDHLKATNEVTTKSTSRNTVITVTKWAFYQGEGIYSDKPNGNQIDKRPTNDRQATDKRPTTNKNVKNDKNGKEEYIARACMSPFRPDPDDVREYIAVKGYHFDVDDFMAYYDSVEWMQRGEPIKDWMSKCFIFEKNWKRDQEKAKQGNPVKAVVPMPDYIRQQIDRGKEESDPQFAWLDKYE